MPCLTMLLFQIPVNIKYTSQNSFWPMRTRSIDSFWLHFYHQFLMRSLLNFCFRQLYKQMKWKTFPVEQGRNTELFIETFTIIGQICQCCFDFMYLDPYVHVLNNDLLVYVQYYDAYQNIWNTVFCIIHIQKINHQHDTLAWV